MKIESSITTGPALRTLLANFLPILDMLLSKNIRYHTGYSDAMGKKA